MWAVAPTSTPVAVWTPAARPRSSVMKRAMGPDVSGSAMSQPLRSAPQRRPARVVEAMRSGVRRIFGTTKAMAGNGKPAARGLCHHPGVTARTSRAPRTRLDQLLVGRGLAESRSRAQALLIGGRVRVGAGDGARLDRKPGDLVD